MTTDQRSGLSSKGPEKTETVLASSVELTQRGTLDLSGKLISLQNCVSVANALRNDSAIIELIINECNVGDKGCALLCESLMENMNVKTLSLKGNGIGQYGSLALAELIRANQTITHLFLDWNTIGLFPDGFNAIFRSLATNVGIVSLDLRNNSLGGIAGMSIAASLKLNQTLQTLDLRWNRLGVVGGQAISESIVHNFTITTLEVTGNEIPDDIINTVEVVVLRNREIQSLSNKKQDDSVDKEHEINKLREQIGQYLSLIEALKKENEGLKNSLDEHNNVLKKINDKLDRLEKENQKLKRDSNKINKLCAQKENDLIKAKQVYDEESKTLKNSLAELQRVEEQNKEKLLKLKQGIEENAKLRDEIKSLNALIKEKEKLLEGQNREIGELKSNYNSLKNSKDAEIAILLNENKQLKDRISLLLEQIKQSEEKATQIERKFDEKIKQLEIKLEECKEKAQKVQNELILFLLSRLGR